MATFHPYSDNAYTSNHFSSTSGGSVSPDTDEGVGRAKVAKWSKEGPVKNACLSCRNKKAKCDAGLPKCGQVADLHLSRWVELIAGLLQCEKKQLECVYVKSRRGGARKKREGVSRFSTRLGDADKSSSGSVRVAGVSEAAGWVAGVTGLQQYHQSGSFGNVR